MKRSKLFALCLAGIILVSTGCNGSKDVDSDSSAETSAPVGDFDFQAQEPITTTVPQGGAVVVDRTDSQIDANAPELEDGYVPPVIEDESGDMTSESGDITVEEVEMIPYVPEYSDLSTNISLQIGRNAYASVPLTLVENVVDIDAFLENMRLAYNLVNEADYFTKNVQSSVYEGGNLLHVAGNVMLLQGMGIKIDIKNVASTLDAAKSVTAEDFALGTLEGDDSSLTAAYSELGAKIDEQDEELFYRAVYEIADVADMDNITAQAVALFDKQTNTLITAVFAINSDLYEGSDITVPILASGVRYSTEAPANLMTIS